MNDSGVALAGDFLLPEGKVLACLFAFYAFLSLHRSGKCNSSLAHQHLIALKMISSHRDSMARWDESRGIADACGMKVKVEVSASRDL